MRYIIITSSVILLALTGCSTTANIQSSKSFRCKDYNTSQEATKAWQEMGKPKESSYDRDGDGKVCPSLGNTQKNTTSKKKTTGCKLTKNVVKVSLSSTKYPNILAHIEEAVKKGYPRVWTINRPGAAERRRKLLQGIPTKPGFDRDEVSPAFARKTWKASVKYVPSSENRSAGARMGTKLRPYCDGQKFMIVGY